MKRIVLILAAILFSSFLQDTIQGIKSAGTQISGRMSGTSFQQDQSQFKMLVNSLNADIEKMRSQVLSTTYYVDFQPVYNDVSSIPLKYDPGTKAFSVMNQVDLNNFYDGPGFLQLDRIVFRYPSGIRVKEANESSVCQAWIDETISFESGDPSLVAKIEGNKDNLRLLFLLSIKSAVQIRQGVKEPTAADYCLMAELKEMLVYNSATGEVYITYRPSPTGAGG